MNTQLVNSIIQVIHALPVDEQQFVIATLNRHFSTSTLPQEPPPNTIAAPSDPSPANSAWDIWHSLGDDAVDGTLDNTSTQHDRYLYTDT